MSAPSVPPRKIFPTGNIAPFKNAAKHPIAINVPSAADACPYKSKYVVALTFELDIGMFPVIGGNLCFFSGSTIGILIVCCFDHFGIVYDASANMLTCIQLVNYPILSKLFYSLSYSLFIQILGEIGTRNDTYYRAK